MYLIGYLQIDIAEVRSGEGTLYLLVAIDRTRKCAFRQMVETATRVTASELMPSLTSSLSNLSQLARLVCSMALICS